MTKRYDDVIEVTSEPEDPGAPLAFVWRGRRYAIDQLLGSWREAGEWWSARRGPTNSDRNGSVPTARDREYFRVLARPVDLLATGDLDPDGFMRSIGAVYDVYLDRARGGWRLARIWD